MQRAHPLRPWKASQGSQNPPINRSKKFQFRQRQAWSRPSRIQTRKNIEPNNLPLRLHRPNNLHLALSRKAIAAVAAAADGVVVAVGANRLSLRLLPQLQ
jgi:hypothetical protein